MRLINDLVSLDDAYKTILKACNVLPKAAPTVSALPPDAPNPHVLLSAYNKEIQIIDFRLSGICETGFSDDPTDMTPSSGT